MKQTLLFISFLALSLLGCNRSQQLQQEGDSLFLAYAENIAIVRHDGYTQVDLLDPWHAGQTLHRYLLVPREAAMPSGLPEGTVLRTPLRRAVISTTVHASLIHDLGQTAAIVGVCEPKYVKNPTLKALCQSGKIVDCGSGLAPDIERIVSTQPEALFLSPFENSGGYGKLERIGIPIVECADYMETSALGRAEWMRFYAMLFGADAQADSLFALMQANYDSIRTEAAKQTAKKPRVMMDKITGAVWYVPGGVSTMAQLMRDAGGQYVFASDTHSGSVPLSFETVLAEAQDADVWLVRTQGETDLLAEKQGYSQFRAWQQKNVWTCDVSTSNFYEETPFRPDRLLQDFYNIIQQNGQPTRYFFRLPAEKSEDSRAADSRLRAFR